MFDISIYVPDELLDTKASQLLMKLTIQNPL